MFFSIVPHISKKINSLCVIESAIKLNAFSHKVIDVYGAVLKYNNTKARTGIIRSTV